MGANPLLNLKSHGKWHRILLKMIVPGTSSSITRVLCWTCGPLTDFKSLCTPHSLIIPVHCYLLWPLPRLLLSSSSFLPCFLRLAAMESQFKSNIDGTQVEESRTNRVHVANPKHIRSSDFLLRLLTIATTLAAALVMGLAKETKIVPVSIFPNTPPIAVVTSAKMSYSSALV